MTPTDCWPIAPEKPPTITRVDVREALRRGWTVTCERGKVLMPWPPERVLVVVLRDQTRGDGRHALQAPFRESDLRTIKLTPKAPDE